jgi:hypothetical protein
MTFIAGLYRRDVRLVPQYIATSTDPFLLPHYSPFNSAFIVRAFLSVSTTGLNGVSLVTVIL